VKHIAVILARGGSKRLPRKNILELQGRPMIAWTIAAAIESACYHRVLVSTDDEEIAAISRAAGAEVPFLRNSAADDMAPSSAATLAALEQAERHWGECYDVVSQLMANCPLRGAGEIRDAVNNFREMGAEFQISCFRFGWMNPWWAAQIGEQGKPEFLFPEARAQRSQDLPPLYCPSGAIWIAGSESLRKTGTFYGPGHILHPMPWMSALDIDDAEDLAMARACFKVGSDRGEA
jgi:N-acylneuraminate cytidylyltransferase